MRNRSSCMPVYTTNNCSITVYTHKWTIPNQPLKCTIYCLLFTVCTIFCFKTDQEYILMPRIEWAQLLFCVHELESFSRSMKKGSFSNKNIETRNNEGVCMFWCKTSFSGLTINANQRRKGEKERKEGGKKKEEKGEKEGKEREVKDEVVLPSQTIPTCKLKIPQNRRANSRLLSLLVVWKIKALYSRSTNRIFWERSGFCISIPCAWPIILWCFWHIKWANS